MTFMSASRPLASGAPAPLGASVVDGGVNFAVWSRHATRVEVVVFDEGGARETGRADLTGRTGDVWHGLLPGAGSGLVYGLRAHGPWDPAQGHRFDPSKLLLDPYARRLTGRFQWGLEHYSGHGRTQDNAATAWKAVVADPQALCPLQPGPTTAWARTLIYELNVKAFTARHPDLSAAERGRFSGLGARQSLQWIKALGITAVELLPVHAFLNDHRLYDQGLSNLWGYNTLSYFAPHPAYGGEDVNAEMRGFVQAAHDTGLEVIMDVVYNHTCEGDHRGPTVSWRGLDNASYYRLRADDKAHYADISGCGSTLDSSSPVVQALVCDSLAHFASAYGVDGYRFDIATSLGIDSHGQFSRDAPQFKAIAADPRLKDLKLIAEPWDAAGGFQVGGFPEGWSEWNSYARDSIRRFWRGDQGEAPEFATRLTGSADIYQAQNRPRRSGVTFVACHDGFTAMDLVSHARKHNLANLENNRDGGDHDFSANHGVEGPTSDPAILALRERQWRNMMASVFLGLGTPMLLAGDEFGRSQGGNNNAYNQDNETSWLDWGLAAAPEGRARASFVRRLAALRDRLVHPMPDGFATHGLATSCQPGVTWWSLWGEPMRHLEWENHAAFAAWFDPGDWLLVVNAGHAAVQFRLPPLSGGRWGGVLDTADPERPEGAVLAGAGEIVSLADRSMRVFSKVAGQSQGVAGRGF